MSNNLQPATPQQSPTPGLWSSDGPLISNCDALLLDLDGVVYLGPIAVPHAVSTITTARDRGVPVAYVTNNSSRPPLQVATHLSELGLAATTADVVTSAQAATRMLLEQLPPPARVLVAGGPGLRQELAQAGYELVETATDQPQAVVQGFNADLGWRDLAEAAYAIQGGAKWLATNTDLTLPNERGQAPGNGSLVQAVANAVGHYPQAAGKPEPALFKYAARALGATKPLVIGDRLDTDLAGAVNSQFPGLLVLTGVSQGRDAALAPAAQRPNFISADLRGLFDVHHAPYRDGDWWRSGSAAATVRDGALEITDRNGDMPDPTSAVLDRIRAVCAAVWHTVDSGGEVDPNSVPEMTL